METIRATTASFVEPIVASISGSHCASAVEQIGQTGAPFSTLEDACHQAINNAILATLMISIVSYKKTPEVMDMLRNGSSPAKFEGAADDGRWSGMRCVGEWFSLIFLISYHHHQEHPVVMWWEQLVLLVNCTVGMFFSMAENDIFDDEMNTFGSISVMGCFVWLLFAIELTGEAIWLLPMLSMMCLIPADMLMIRYGHIQEETQDERTGAIVPGKNVIDGDYASHAIYFVVCSFRSVGLWSSSMGVQWMPSDWWCSSRYTVQALCAMMLAVESALVTANNMKKDAKQKKSREKKEKIEKAIDQVSKKD